MAIARAEFRPTKFRLDRDRSGNYVELFDEASGTIILISQDTWRLVTDALFPETVARLSTSRWDVGRWEDLTWWPDTEPYKGRGPWIEL